LDSQGVAIDRDAHAATVETARDRRETVAFLDAELGEPAHDRATAGAGGGDREDRVFVDHPRRPLRGDVCAGQNPGASAQIGDRLAPLVAFVQQGEVSPHLTQTFEEPSAQWVDTDALDRDFRARNDQRRDQWKGCRGRVARYGDRHRGELRVALDGDALAAAFGGLDFNRRAEMT